MGRPPEIERGIRTLWLARRPILYDGSTEPYDLLYGTKKLSGARNTKLKQVRFARYRTLAES